MCGHKTLSAADANECDPKKRRRNIPGKRWREEGTKETFITRFILLYVDSRRGSNIIHQFL